MASHERGLGDSRDSCCCWLSRNGPSQHSRREMVCPRMPCSWGSVRSAAPLHSQEIQPPDGGGAYYYPRCLRAFGPSFAEDAYLDDRILSRQTQFTYCQTMRLLSCPRPAIGWSVGSTRMRTLIDASLRIRTETVCLRMSLSHAEVKPQFLKANWSLSRRQDKDGFNPMMRGSLSPSLTFDTAKSYFREARKPASNAAANARNPSDL
jgi:hypothetical protein